MMIAGITTRRWSKTVGEPLPSSMWVISPSRMWRMRSAIWAASGLWVIMRTVWLSSRLDWRSILRTASEFLVSRLPVGSSARTMAGRLMRARAIATRCCSPPESSLGRWSRRPSMPSMSVRWSRRGLSSSRLVDGAEVGDVVGDLDVAHGGERGQQVEALEDEADLGAAHFGAFGIGEFGEVDAVDEDGAGGGAGEAAEDVEERGFAGAGGADDGDELAGGDGEVDVAEGGDLEFAGAVGLAEVLGEDDGRVTRLWIRRGGQRGRMRKHVDI